MFDVQVATFQNYMGTGLLLGWFLLTAIYLLIVEKRKDIRIVFVYVPGLVLVLLFFPPFAELMYEMAGEETYFRMFWLLPVTPATAYGAVHLYKRVKGRWKPWCAVGLAVLVMLSGNFIYANPLFSRAQNIYHMPTAVVEICDAIEVEGREVMAVFPVELIPYVRQYCPVVCMPYGREVLTQIWGNWNELLGVMEAETIDADKLAQLAKEKLCHYVILPEDKEIIGSLTEHDYIFLYNIEGYDVYRDTTIYIGL